MPTTNTMLNPASPNPFFSSFLYNASPSATYLNHLSTK